MIAARAAGAERTNALLAAVGAAVLARAALGGAAPAASVPGAVVFSALLGAAVIWAGGRVTRIPWRGAAFGVGGAAALVALSLVGLPAVRLAPRAASGTLLWWMPLVTSVAATEELVLRGVLFDAVRARAGDACAVALTAILFALMHLPLYGLPALGIDLCVGVFLGCLRLLSGTVSAPLVAHVLADLATGWLG